MLKKKGEKFFLNELKKYIGASFSKTLLALGSLGLFFNVISNDAIAKDQNKSIRNEQMPYVQGNIVPIKVQELFVYKPIDKYPFTPCNDIKTKKEGAISQVSVISDKEALSIIEKMIKYYLSENSQLTKKYKENETRILNEVKYIIEQLEVYDTTAINTINNFLKDDCQLTLDEVNKIADEYGQKLFPLKKVSGFDTNKDGVPDKDLETTIDWYRIIKFSNIADKEALKNLEECQKNKTDCIKDNENIRKEKENLEKKVKELQKQIESAQQDIKNAKEDCKKIITKEALEDLTDPRSKLFNNFFSVNIYLDNKTTEYGEKESNLIERPRAYLKMSHNNAGISLITQNKKGRFVWAGDLKIFGTRDGEIKYFYYPPNSEYYSGEGKGTYDSNFGNYELEISIKYLLNESQDEGRKNAFFIGTDLSSLKENATGSVLYIFDNNSDIKKLELKNEPRYALIEVGVKHLESFDLYRRFSFEGSLSAGVVSNEYSNSDGMLFKAQIKPAFDIGSFTLGGVFNFSTADLENNQKLSSKKNLAKAELFLEYLLKNKNQIKISAGKIIYSNKIDNDEVSLNEFEGNSFYLILGYKINR